MTKYLCIHGHFYQPPRENPWLEVVEKQDSASPYHDWNERITAEAYAPNARSRILDDQGWITKIVNNYGRLSFNFGPTLLNWIEENKPEVHEALLQADRKSRERFDGHGSALAQPYNHIIMPLASSRDKYTQIEWGIEDFRSRFDREPEGMWLPETAVDLETLRIMTEFGIKFTLLAPHQIRNIRNGGEETWHEVTPEELDTTHPYEVELPGKSSIVVFPYDGRLSNAVAFEGLLEDGDRFARKLINAFPEDPEKDTLVHIATDGETYGHHHKHGDMALAYALSEIEKHESVNLTNYGSFLEKHTPQQEALIEEETSWSCAHGIERWRDDCGCSTGGEEGWNQQWRKPLREGLDQLREKLDPLFEQSAKQFFSDPWEARNRYISVVLDRSPDSISNFFSKQGANDIPEEQKTKALKLLELQRNRMLMYTSCGWFFADVSDIGTIQILRYCDRAMQLAEDLFEEDFRTELLSKLEEGRSNVERFDNAREVYEYFVTPARVEKERVAAHYAILSLFEGFEEQEDIYSYGVNLNPSTLQISQLGDAKLTMGEVEVLSKVTGDKGQFEFGTIYFGEQNLSAGVRSTNEGEDLEICARAVLPPFEQGDLPNAQHGLGEKFGPLNYSLTTLFRDDQRRVLNSIIEERLEGVENEYERIYEDHLPLMRYLVEHDVKLPYVFQNTAEFTLNTELRTSLSGPALDLEKARELVEQIRKLGLEFQDGHLEYEIRERLKDLSKRLRANPRDRALLETILDLLAFVDSIPLEVDTRDIQNTYYEVAGRISEELRSNQELEEPERPEWVQTFLSLGEELKVRIP